MQVIYLIFAAFLLVGGSVSALAQSSPGLSKGQVPTAGQWNQFFATKQDALGFVPLNRAGGSMLGALKMMPSGPTGAGANVGVGQPPQNPQNGDIWATPSGFYIHAGGVTYNISPAGLIGTPTGSSLGGLYSATAPSHKFQTGVDLTGTPTFAQPAYADLAGSMPAPSTNTLGGVYALSGTLHQFQTGVSTGGSPLFAQPQVGDVMGAVSNAQPNAWTAPQAFNGNITLLGSGNSSTIYALGNAQITDYTNPQFYFNANDALGSFGSGNAHFGFVIEGGKNLGQGVNTTGNRGTLIAKYSGAGGGSSSDYLGSAVFQTLPIASSDGTNNLGNFTALNAQVIIPPNMAPSTVVPLELDVTLQSTTALRQAIRIVDQNSTFGGTAVDAAFNIVNAGGRGFSTVLNLGDTAATFGVVGGGSIIDTPVGVTTALTAGINLSKISGAYTYAPVVLAANNKGIWWGQTHAGGSIVSETATGGMDVVLGNGFVGFRNGTSIGLQANSDNTSQLAFMTISQLLAIRCSTTADVGKLAFVRDNVANAAPSYHGQVQGGGSTVAISLATCNGGFWQWD